MGIRILTHFFLDRLKLATQLFGEEVFIVAEADWQAREKETGDPLIVGVRGKTCYLVDTFDCTPREDYVRREFRI